MDVCVCVCVCVCVFVCDLRRSSTDRPGSLLPGRPAGRRGPRPVAPWPAWPGPLLPLSRFLFLFDSHSFNNSNWILRDSERSPAPEREG